MQLRRIFALVFLLVFASGLGAAPKYIFLFIGDGFGSVQANAAGAYLAATSGRPGVAPLAMDSLPVYGTATTFAENRLITDSAAAGTALATGRKTFVNRISTAADGVTPLRTVAEAAHGRGMKVGIVTTVSVDHATPAVFYSHRKDRDMYYEISLDLSASGFEYFAGGPFLSPKGDPQGDATALRTGLGSAPASGTMPDSRSVAVSRGYRFAATRAEFDALRAGDSRIVAVAAGGDTVPYAIDRSASDMTLALYTKKGIELLAGERGFFMMVEGGKIDWACHMNDAATAVREVLDFDAAISAALDFYKAHPADTLIVVTSDHETGGMALGWVGRHYESDIALLALQKGSCDAFAAKVDDLRRANPKADFDAVMDLVRDFYGLGTARAPLSADETAELRKAYDALIAGAPAAGTPERARYDDAFGGKNPVGVAACLILAHKAGIGWTSFSHSAASVPVRAIGPGSELFAGAQDNTDIPRHIFELMGEAPAAK